MSLDGTELDFTDYIAHRKAAVEAALWTCRAYLIEARVRHEANPTPDTRRYLILAMAGVEVGEAELDAITRVRT